MNTKFLKKIRQRARGKVTIQAIHDEGDGSLIKYVVIWSKKTLFSSSKYKTFTFLIDENMTAKEQYQLFLNALAFANKKANEWAEYFYWRYKRNYKWHNPKKDWRKHPGY